MKVLSVPPDIASYLAEDEEILKIAKNVQWGTETISGFGSAKGEIYVTNRRVIFKKGGGFLEGKQIVEASYRHIESMKEKIGSFIHQTVMFFLAAIAIIFIIICFAFLVSFIEWCVENPFWGMTFLGSVMIGLPVFLFIKNVALKKDVRTKQKMKWGIVVGYFIGFFAWISAVLLGIVGDLFAILGVCVFLGSGIIVLIYHITRGKLKKRMEERKKTLAWELEDQLRELKEQLGRGAITQEEYEQKKKMLKKKIKSVNE